MPWGRVEANTGPYLCFFEVFAYCFEDVLEVFSIVVVLGGLDVEVNLVSVFSVVVIEVVLGGDFVVNLASHHQAGLVGPAPCHVLDRVASTT